jgi:GTP-binding protein
MKFVDEVKIIAEAGAGGNGCVSFRREKFVPRGGPDGGDGGNGGSILLRGDRGLQTLYDLQLRPFYRAGRGVHGKGKGMDGRYGADIVIKIPLGVAVYEGKRILGEILRNGEDLRVAAGGKGGRGNRHFASASRQSPRYAEKGQAGEKHELQLILKLISDVGIVGLPNAGKSTLLKAITNARPRIADYPFTTLTPNLGVVKQDQKSIVVADMPGIIAEAHTGKGLGIRFLRHIERTNLLIILIDIAQPNPRDQYDTIIHEFRQYGRDLLKKPRIVVFNKTDLLTRIPKFDLPERIFYLSALTGKGVRDLSAYLIHEDIVKDR